MKLQKKYDAGLAHLAASRLASAEACFRAVIAAHPRFAPAHHDLGVVLWRRRRLQHAAHAFQNAIHYAPDLAPAHMALAAVLQRMGQDAEAEPHARRAIAIDPNFKAARILLADVLRALGRHDEALAIHESILRVAPHDPDARFGRGFLRLLQGDLAAGWADYEYRPARRQPPVPALQPQWQGENPAGKTLLLHGEQGLGDTLQFIRFAEDLADRGARVLVFGPLALAGLLARAKGVDAVAPPALTLPPFDYSCPLPSLARLCPRPMAALARPGGYLTAPPDHLARWRERLGEDERRLTVAIGWAGHPDHPNDHNRSMTLADIAPLFDIPGVRWLIVQKGAQAGDFARYRQAEITPLGDQLNDFSDTAAIVAQADLVVSVDTALCHLAGALGRPTFTLLPFAPDWRWLRDRTDSPWYPTMRLFRQAAPGDWAGVVAAVTADIRKRAASQALDP